MRTITLGDAATLSAATGTDNLPNNAGFVRTPNGYISSHAAFELVVAGKLDPAKNAQACRSQDAEDTWGLSAKLEATASAKRAQEKAQRDKEGRQRHVDRVKREKVAAERMEAGASAIRRKA